MAYHLIWCPKYRRKILIGSIAKDLIELLKLKAKELDIEIEDMKVMPDHVHLFVNANPTAAPHWIVQQLKARQVAKIALKTRTRSSADVRHIGLKSMIANQILRKNSNNLKAKNSTKSRYQG